MRELKAPDARNGTLFVLLTGASSGSNTGMRYVLVIATLVSVPPLALADESDIFLCVDEQGNKSFQVTSTGKGCKKVDVGPVRSPPSSKPLPPERPAPRAAAPSRPAPPPAPALTAPPKQASGTAFFVSAQGHAVTNFHVVDGCDSLRTAAGDTAVVVGTDRNRDLALIQSGRGIRPAAKLVSDTSRVRQGEEIVVYGFPLGKVLSDSGNITPGIISALSGLNGDSSRIQITAPIQPGSSGSAVISRNGEVVGVVSSRLSDEHAFRATGAIPQNVNFAISVSALRAFLDRNKVPYTTGRGQAVVRDTADLADDARRWTTRIECLSK